MRDRFEIGDTAGFSKTVTEADIYMFADLTGDKNPVHIDEEYAKETVFGGRIAHGMLVAGYVGAVMAMKLPGPGSIYLEQTLTFLAPVRIGDTITATAEIIELGKKKKARLRTTCVNQDGILVLDGYAMVRLPRR